MLKRILVLILTIVLLIPIIPASQAEFYDTCGHKHYVLTCDWDYAVAWRTETSTGNVTGIVNATSAHIVSDWHNRFPSHAAHIPNPTRTGYRFVEWEIVSGDGIFTYEEGFARVQIFEDTHVLAIWEECPDIHIPPVGAILVPSHNSPETAYIDLTTETITLPITVGAYSVNGGKSWKIGALPSGEAFSKLLGRGITLWVAQGYDKKAKIPTGTTFNFPRIERRPKANPEKLRAHKLDTTWDLRTKDGVLPTATYQWAPTTDRKKPSGAWQPLNDGLPPLPGAKQRLTVLVRTPPSASAATTVAPARYVPAGKAWRAQVKG